MNRLGFDVADLAMAQSKVAGFSKYFSKFDDAFCRG